MSKRAWRTIRRFLLIQAVIFLAAALVHAGVLVRGYEHRAARIAESVIAAVLFLGLLASWLRPAWTRAAGVVAQGFALLGTCVGLFTIAVGVGPRTVPDVAYHVAIIVVLAWGLGVAWRARALGSPT
ncbi:MAG TPA: hypothetical protein VF188_02510 [Longimicrobiales bacterium]